MLRVRLRALPDPVQVYIPDSVNNGLLYNWPVVNRDNADKITSSDDWVVPLLSELTPLITFLGGTSVAGGKLKETGTVYFDSPNTGATNEVSFNARGAGGRVNDWSSFLIKQWCGIWTASQYSASTAYAYYLQHNSESCLLYTTGIVKYTGMSIRPMRTSTSLANGESGTYQGNNGLTYRTICINGVEWVADNLAETKFRDGSYIPGFDAGVYTPFTNAAWAALTTAGCCAYNDDTSNI